MKLLLISDEETNGGAGISASNLSRGLVRRNIDVLRLVIFPNFQKTNPWRTRQFWERRTIIQKVIGRTIPKLPVNIRSSVAIENLKRLIKKENPVAINFHNILWGIDWGYSLEMYEIAADCCPTFITLHDMWNIIGYPYDLERITDKNILDNWEIPEVHLRGKSKKEQSDLRNVIFKNKNIHFIAPSNWLREELVKEYPFTKSRVSVIPYGVDTEIFNPGNRNKRVELLNRSKGKINVLASAASLEHVNKGFHVLMNILTHRLNSDIRLLLMGDDVIINQYKMPEDLEWVSFGYVKAEEEKAEIYNAADVLAFPSFADNLPNSVLESMACGTPVIAFNTCGLPDLVKPDISGWLSDTVSLESYTETFEKAIRDLQNGLNLRNICRDYVLDNFTIEKQAVSYEHLIQDKIKPENVKEKIFIES